MPTYTLTNNADTFTAGNGDDIIYGLGGNDRLSGGNGDDAIYGDAGNDTLSGNAGSDLLEGGTGNDTLYGDAGADYVYGGAGNDTVRGGANDDFVYGGTGADTLYGDGGADFLEGGAGRDRFAIPTATGAVSTVLDWDAGGDADYVLASFANYDSNGDGRVTAADVSVTAAGDGSLRLWKGGGYLELLGVVELLPVDFTG